MRFISVIDVFGAIKDVKVRGLEQSYCNNFKDPAKKYASYQSSAQIVSQIPRFVLEALTFGGMILLILYLLSINSELDKILALISIYALAGYRLMPSLQQVYSGFSQIRYSAPGVRALYYDISSLDKNYDNLNGNPIVFNSDIRLKNIEFKYNKSDKPSLKNINISINAFSKVGIVGHTGSGKTTLVDLILGNISQCLFNLSDDNLKKKNAEVYGIEPNEDALRICQIKASQNGIPKENILKGYSESIPFDDSYFDFVYCFTVLEHVSDVEQSISEMVRCVKNKGKVFIETPDYRQLYEGHYKLPLPMFLPVWINKLLLKLFRRPTKFIESINKVNSNILIKHYSKLPVTPIRVYRDNSVSFPSFKPNISFLVEITQYLIHKFLGIYINHFWLLHKGIN